tara:strand:- start:1699 stop:2760 length:1062 start_codon:yes stop_codon:yes gene_type:complete
MRPKFILVIIIIFILISINAIALIQEDSENQGFGDTTNEQSNILDASGDLNEIPDNAVVTNGAEVKINKAVSGTITIENGLLTDQDGNTARGGEVEIVNGKIKSIKNGIDVKTKIHDQELIADELNLDNNEISGENIHINGIGVKTTDSIPLVDDPQQNGLYVNDDDIIINNPEGDIEVTRKQDTGTTTVDVSQSSPDTKVTVKSRNKGKTTTEFSVSQKSGFTVRGSPNKNDNVKANLGTGIGTFGLFPNDNFIPKNLFTSTTKFIGNAMGGLNLGENTNLKIKFGNKLNPDPSFLLIGDEQKMEKPERAISLQLTILNPVSTISKNTWEFAKHPIQKTKKGFRRIIGKGYP